MHASKQQKQTEQVILYPERLLLRVIAIYIIDVYVW